MKRKKGFTLPEVVVVLSITVIVMSLVASLIVIVSKASTHQNSQNTYQTEYRTASALVDEFFNTYNTQNFEISDFQENQIVVSDGLNQFILKFEQDAKQLSAEILKHNSNQTQTRILDFLKLTEIKFSRNGNIIMSEYIFDNDVTYRQIITFGV